MKINERDISRLKHMTGQTICHNRRLVLGFVESGKDTAEENAPDLAEAEVYAMGMRWHWADCFTPPTGERRFHKAIHICHNCADIPGAPWAAEVREEHQRAWEASEASWAPTLYAERVMKMGGKWGDDDRVEHDPRTAKLYRILDKFADFEELE